MAANFRDAQITVRMLGGLEIRKNGAPVALPTRHSALLFAALALEPGAPISRARLASLFWGGRGEPQARGSLRQTIYRLRRVFEDVTPEPLIATSMAISVSPALVWSDAAEILSGGHGAQSLVNGELLAGWDGGSAELDDWIAGQRETIRQASGRVLRDAAEAAERSGDFAALADSAERLSRLDPFDEAALRLRMSALARMGRIAAAEELHHEFVFRLAHDLSARPSEETTRLAAEISERSGAFAPVAPPFAQNLQSPVGAAATPAPEDLAERRQITVVAIALSPDRAENDADPEAIAERLHRLGALVGDLASKFGGTCDRAASLAYVCVFGWPRAMEDAAERAARVAAAIVDIARGEEIAIGLGVATSEVIAEPGAGRFIGRAPDEALRLAAGARAGEILVSGRARALLEPAFGFEESPAPSTAGARALTGERIAESRFAARHSGQIGRMVGRERELDLLLGLWRLADRGEGQVAVIRGEPGIGKSRLVEAMARELDAEAPQRTLLQCSRFAADTAFGPIAEHIRLAGGLAAVTGARTREERLTGYLRSLDLHGDPAAADIGVLAGVTRSTAPPSAERRGALLASLVRLLTGGSDDRATLLVLEDAHWADPSTLDVLLRLAVESPERRIMIVVTSRPEFDHGALPDANLTALSLRALSRSQVEDLARDIAGGRELEEGFIEAVCDRADGVPLFAEEIVRAAFETGGGAAPTHTPAPGALRDILLARLDRLGPAKVVAQHAACIGRRFDRTLLAAALTNYALPLDGALARMIEDRIVFPHEVNGAENYVFRHALVRDAAYESLPRSSRVAAHKRIHLALATRADPDPGVAARHAREAGLDAEAIRWLRAAGAVALAQFAHREARSRFEQALAILEASGEDLQGERLELLGHIGLCQAHALGYGHPETIASLDAARRLALRHPDSPHAIPVLWQTYSARYTQADLEETRKIGEELLALSTWNDDYGPQATAGWRFIAAADMLAGRFREAEEALARAEAALDAQPTVRSVSTIGIDHRVAIRLHKARVAACLGRTEEARRLLALNEKEVRAEGRTHSLILSLTLSCVVNLTLRDFTETHRLASESLLLCERSKTSMWWSYAAAYEALSSLLGRGEVDAIRRYEAARRELSASGTRVSMTLCDSLFAEGLAASGDITRAERAILSAVVATDAGQEPWCAPEVLRLDGEIGRESCRLDSKASADRFQQAIAIASEQNASLWLKRLSSSTDR